MALSFSPSVLTTPETASRSKTPGLINRRHPPTAPTAPDDQGQRGSYAIAANGRIVVVGGEFERVQTASPADPHLRTIARVHAAPYAVAIVGTRIVFEELLSRSTGRLVLLRPNGHSRAITPRMALGGLGLAFDGHTLAFVSGGCVYAGPIPATTPTGPPPGC
jgi:hypothetical protein